MSENGILLGKRHFLFSKSKKIYVGGWTFTLAPGITLIAGGSADPVHTLISLYRESEKVAQMTLVHRKTDTQLTVQAVSSDILLEVAACAHHLIVSEKK